MEKSEWETACACLLSIFDRFGQNDADCDGKNVGFLSVAPSYFKVRCQPEKKEKPVGGVRGEITDFSRKARLRMMQKITSMFGNINWWQHLTFADDVLQGKSELDRWHFSAVCMHRLQKRLKRKFPEVKGFWKREYKPRLSGALVGEVCPHYHIILDLGALEFSQYHAVGVAIAEAWVAVTGTQDKKALEVALYQGDRKKKKPSFEYLPNPDRVKKYVFKYMDKAEKMPSGARGRFWGRIGKVEVAAETRFRITKADEVMLNRLARKKAKNYKNGKWEKNKVRLRYLRNKSPSPLNQGYIAFFSISELARAFEWHYKRQEEKQSQFNYRGEVRRKWRKEKSKSVHA